MFKESYYERKHIMGCHQYIGRSCDLISVSQSRPSMRLLWILYTLLLLLVSCATNKSVSMVLLPEGKLYLESQSDAETVYKDEHSAGASCRVWH
jgi:hypothetical protein